MKLNGTQIAEFEERGYLFFPNLLDAKEVAALQSTLPEIMNRPGPEVIRETGDPTVARLVFGAHVFSEPFRRLSLRPNLLHPVRQLLGDEVYLHQSRLNPKQGFGHGAAWDWHQDYPPWHAIDGMPEPKAMNYAVFLDDVNEFNGPIAFIPSSHRQGELASEAEVLPGITPLYTMNTETIATLAEANGIVSPKGPAGSAVFFDSCMAHTSTPNISPWPRNIVYLTCNRTDNFIRTPTRPHYYAGNDFEAISPLPDDCLSNAPHTQHLAT